MSEGRAICNTEILSVAPQAASSGQVRRWATGHLRHWQLADDTVDAAVLMLSEAVTNVFVHARTDSTVSIALTGEHLDVNVADLAPRPAEADDRLARTRPDGASAAAEPLAESGRGLQIIDALAPAWGIRDAAGGKQLWFRLRVHRAVVDLTACPCRAGQSA